MMEQVTTRPFGQKRRNASQKKSNIFQGTLSKAEEITNRARRATGSVQGNFVKLLLVLPTICSGVIQEESKEDIKFVGVPKGPIPETFWKTLESEFVTHRPSMVVTYFGRRENLRHDLVAEVLSDMADAGSIVLHFDQRIPEWGKAYWKDPEPIKIYDALEI